MPDMPLTQPSYPGSQLTQEGYSYVLATGDDFFGGLQCWLSTAVDCHQIQCAIIFKAGETVNVLRHVMWVYLNLYFSQPMLYLDL